MNKVRFLDINDYAQCVNVVLDQKEFIEEYWKEDYRYWIQPLPGWLHPDPYERLKGSFLNQEKRLAGVFYNDELLSFAGLICYQRTDVAIHIYRMCKKIPKEDSEDVYVQLTKFLFQWGVSVGKREIFGCRHPSITKNVTAWIGNDEYFSNHICQKIIATYDAYEIPTNNFHYEIMEFTPYAFPIDILQSTVK